jgi:hypothetical protein
MKHNENLYLDEGMGESEVFASDGTDFLVAMAEASASVSPAPRRALKLRILKAIADEDAFGGSEATNSERSNSLEASVIRANAGQWLASGIEGITMKLLQQIEDPNVEAGHKRYSVLARLAKGAQYPHHRHVGYEECLVIEGDLHVNDLSLHAGDYILTQPGDEHLNTWTDGGCLLMLSTQLEDEILSM